MKIVQTGLLLLAMLGPAAMVAQLATGGGPDGPRGGHHQMPSVDDQVKRLSKELKLTDTQRSQIKPILQEQQDQMRQLMQNSASREENWPKMREIHQNTSASIRALLTDEQKTKYDQMEAERRERMQKRLGGNDGPPPQNGREVSPPDGGPGGPPPE